MDIEFMRLLRTATSERHLLRRAKADFASLDLHYLPNATVQATLLIFDGSGFGEEEIPALLMHIDEVLLPEVQLDHQNLTFTVAFGRVLGAYQADEEGPASDAALH